MDVAPYLMLGVKSAIAMLMRDVKGIKAVVISTEDGFEVDSQMQNTAQVSRLSAMASSLSALGALAGEESQLGNCESMVMEASDGLIAVLQVPHPAVAMTLSVVAGRDAVVGQVLYFSKQAASKLALCRD